MAKNDAESAFVFDGDHGDEPEPGQVMTWSQWDDVPLAVINDDGTYTGALVVASNCTSTREAIAAARKQLNAWTESLSTIDYLDEEIRRLGGELAHLTERIEAARAFGHDDRVDEAIAEIPDLAREITELTITAN